MAQWGDVGPTVVYHFVHCSMSDKNTLGARIIDRTLRPLFPEGYAHEVQVRPRLCQQHSLTGIHRHTHSLTHAVLTETWMRVGVLHPLPPFHVLRPRCPQIIATLLSYDPDCEPEAVRGMMLPPHTHTRTHIAHPASHSNVPTALGMGRPALWDDVPLPPPRCP
jgi:hypothetical protein